MRSVAAPVRDGAGAVRAAMNVTVHAAETSTEHLLRHSAPAAGDRGPISADWALWQSRPHARSRGRLTPSTADSSVKS